MTRFVSSGLRLPHSVNALALKIAGPVAIMTALGCVLLGDGTDWTPVLAGGGGGLVTYATAHYWLHRPLQQMRTTLQHIREHDFEELSPPTVHNDELGALFQDIYRTGQTLDNEIQELKERESYRREFIGNVSHELKTPIFSAQGFAETLLDGALEDENVNRTFLRKILNNVSRLEQLARDLSAITKIETDEMEMSKETFDLREVFADVQESLELKSEEKEIALRTDLSDDLPSAYGDRDRIRRVLVNLADNAIKYNEAGGTVTLKARAPSDEEVSISVADDGIGIPPEHVPRLTERFYRVDKSRSRNQGGTGLGLAIVKHILAAHDCTLQVESTPGEGSTFHFSLPSTSFASLQSE